MSRTEIKSPYELFIINYLTRIHDSLDHLDYYTASVALQHCMYALPPDIKKEFGEKSGTLNDLIEKRSNLRASNLVHIRMKQKKFDKRVVSPFLLNFLSQVWDILFEKGYITKGYGFFDPSQGRKSGGKRK